MKGSDFSYEFKRTYSERVANKICYYCKKIPFVSRYYEKNARELAYKKLIKRLKPFNKNHLNNKKTSLVISGENSNIGIFCWIEACIRMFRFCEITGLTPVIDMKNVRTLYHRSGEIGIVNTWELFFKQPTDLSLEEAYKGPVVFVDRLDSFDAFFEHNKMAYEEALKEDWLYDLSIRPYWRTLYKKYIRLTEGMNQYIDSLWKEICGEDDKILGVLMRGTDYKNNPKNHPVQPTLKQEFRKIDEICSEYSVDRIFLATEDLEILQAFLLRFGTDFVSFVEQERVAAVRDGELVADKYRKNGIDIKKNGRDYVAAMYLLSRCSYFIGAHTSATRYIPLMRDDEFEYEYIWDLGLN